MKLTRSEIDTIEHKIEAGTHDLDSQLQALKEKIFSLEIAKGIVSNKNTIFIFLFKAFLLNKIYMLEWHF